MRNRCDIYTYRSTIKPVPFAKRPDKPQGIAPMTNKHDITRRGPHRSHNGPTQSRATTFHRMSVTSL